MPVVNQESDFPPSLLKSPLMRSATTAKDPNAIAAPAKTAAQISPMKGRTRARNAKKPRMIPNSSEDNGEIVKGLLRFVCC